MFNTVADTIQPGVNDKTQSLNAAFQKTCPSPDLELCAYHEELFTDRHNGLLAGAKASLSNAQRHGNMLATMFGVTSITALKGDAADDLHATIGDMKRHGFDPAELERMLGYYTVHRGHIKLKDKPKPELKPKSSRSKLDAVLGIFEEDMPDFGSLDFD